jgi:hypothetical protein
MMNGTKIIIGFSLIKFSESGMLSDITVAYQPRKRRKNKRKMESKKKDIKGGRKGRNERKYSI